ncbi:Beta-lactamase-like protein [Cladobotryum mycophilum]|uniref:Beta-lactamase-like protein n=1 Tax=Cladobotryum mycophilum TaxID=491253 RepID=A0ABR0ST85_9HYPO
MHFHLQSIFLASLFPGLVPAALNCRPEGPVLPKPTALGEAPIFQDATNKLTKTFDDAISGHIKAGWDVNNVTFSVAVISADQTVPGVPVWEYHHLAKANKNGTKNLDRDSQYLIGSVTKVISAYLLLKSDIDLDSPVAKYLKKLADPKSLVQWKDISLRMLAEHLAGVPANYGFSEFYFLKEVFLSLGFPPVNDSDYPPCGVIALNKDCSPNDFLDGMLDSYPVTAPMERPAYSNVAFTIFIMALEEATGKNYSQMVDEFVVKPLDLKNTLPSPGDDKKAVIPPGESSWGADYGYNAPGGGLVSSLSDLSKFTHALLSRTLDLTPTQIRQWLKPQSFSGGPYSSVGMPWEIYRPLNLTPEHPHAITIYGKGGGAQAYRSQLEVIDEYGLGLVIMTAGPMQALTLITDALLATIVPAVDKVSRDQAKQHSRKFSGKGENGTGFESTLVQDKDSLVLKSIHSGTSDLLKGLVKIWNLTIGEYVGTINPTVRLFPSDLNNKATIDEKNVTREVWHLWPQADSSPASELPGAGTQDSDCITWTIGDWAHYGGEPMDRVLFYKEDGKVVGFELPFLRSGILRPT